MAWKIGDFGNPKKLPRNGPGDKGPIPYLRPGNFLLVTRFPILSGIVILPPLGNSFFHSLGGIGLGNRAKLNGVFK